MRRKMVHFSAHCHFNLWQFGVIIIPKEYQGVKFTFAVNLGPIIFGLYFGVDKNRLKKK
jgi:hypothetical protein